MCCSCRWASHKERWERPVFRSMVLHLWLIFITSPNLEGVLDALRSLPTQWLFLLLLLAQLPSTDQRDQFEGWYFKPVLRCCSPLWSSASLLGVWSWQAREGCWKQLPCHLESPHCLNLVHKNPQCVNKVCWHWASQLGRIPQGSTAGCCVGLSFTEGTGPCHPPKKRVPLLGKE